MTTQHTVIDFYAGDDWEIRATLLDENGNPYNLSPLPQLEWALLDHNYQRVINGTDISISITDAAAGKCAIFVPSESTTTVLTGVYTDTLRITIGGITSTLWIGSVHVTTDAFK
jgi:hypothetical protein